MAAGGAWLLARGLDALLGTRAVDGLDVVVRTGDGPAFPVASVAAFTALTVALSPYLTRPIRRLLLVTIPFVALAAMYLGIGFASDAAGGLWLGIAAGALVHLAFGAPGGRPSAAQILDALTELGVETISVTPSAARRRPRHRHGRRAVVRARRCASWPTGGTSATASSPLGCGTP